MIVLVDQGTASAAEILAAALRDHGRAKLVGQPTYGKGTVQTFYDLEDGAGLKLTTARYYTPKGNSLESKGLVPDVRVDAFAPEEIVVGGDGSGAGPGNGATIDRVGRRRSTARRRCKARASRQLAARAEASSRSRGCFVRAWTVTTNETFAFL